MLHCASVRGVLLPGALAGPYKSKEVHAASAKAAVTLLGGLQKQGGAGRRLADLLGPEAVRELGKTVVLLKVRRACACLLAECVRAVAPGQP